MWSASRLAALVCAVLTASVVAPRAQAPAPSETRATYSERATAILVDAVVRDKRGQPVLDLKSDDFEVYEDGVRQDIGSFTLVSKGAGIGVKVRVRPPDEGHTAIVEPTGSTSGAAQPYPTVVALVFDALSPEALSICQKAALEQIRMIETDAQIGVFETEPSIRVVQHYTSDPARIRNAVRQLNSGGTEVKRTREERIDELRTRQAQMGAGMDPNTAVIVGSGGAGNVPQIGQAEVQKKLIETEMRMLRTFDALDRDYRGYSATNALTSIVDSMQLLTGRKALLFFSEGLPASPVLKSKLEAVIEAANRSNVTVYTVDARGLRIQSLNTETKKEVEALGAERLRQTESPQDRTDEPLSRGIERAEDLLQFSGEAGLTRLADDTGGFMVRDTNDMGSAFKRIDEDLRFHYLLTYSPKNDALDGKFRTIDVKVKRPGVMVFSRKGYRASPRALPPPDLAYETPAIALLDRAPLPNAFPSQARAFVFPAPGRPGLAPIVVRVPTEVLAFDVDDKKGTYSAQASVVVRIRNAAGQPVQKLSQQYVLTGDKADIGAAKNGEILFYREAELPPGSYQVESIVYDAISGKGSARVATLVVPRADESRLRISSVMLVARTEQTSAPDASRPFYYGDRLLYPNLGEPLERARDRDLAFYFVVYPVPARTACSAHISLLRNGQVMADTSRELAAPEQPSDRLQQVGTLPVSQLPPGTYELRVTVSDSHDEETQSTFFTLS